MLIKAYLEQLMHALLVVKLALLGTTYVPNSELLHFSVVRSG